MPIAMPKLEGLCSQREARWFYAWYASVYEQLQPFFTSDSMREAGLDLAGVRGNVLDVLDVGAGTGTLSMQMVMRGIEPRKLTLLDQSDSMLKRARAKHALSLSTFVLADATHSLPLPSESRDRVVSSGVLYYFPDPVGALREQMRICRPGGIVLAMGSLQPKPRFIRMLAETFNRFPSEEQYKSWFEEAGFVDIKAAHISNPWNAEQYALAICGTRPEGIHIPKAGEEDAADVPTGGDVRLFTRLFTRQLRGLLTLPGNVVRYALAMGAFSLLAPLQVLNATMGMRRMRRMGGDNSGSGA